MDRKAPRPESRGKKQVYFKKKEGEKEKVTAVTHKRFYSLLRKYLCFIFNNL